MSSLNQLVETELGPAFIGIPIHHLIELWLTSAHSTFIGFIASLW
jgi:hypothetical protein